MSTSVHGPSSHQYCLASPQVPDSSSSDPLSCVTNLSSSSPRLCSAFPGHPHPYPSAEDVELDEDELDREIRGYGSDAESDDLDIEVGSDEFEVVGVVYKSDEEEEEFLDISDGSAAVEESVENGDYDFEPSGYADYGLPGALGARSDVAEHDDTEEKKPFEREATMKPVAEYAWADEGKAGPSTSTMRPASEISGSRKSTRLQKRKRGDGSEVHAETPHFEDAGDSDSEEEGSAVSTPPKKKVRGSHPALAPQRKARMPTKQARRFDKRVAATQCGIDGCLLTITRTTAQTHLEQVHYPAQSGKAGTDAQGTSKPSARKGKGKGKNKENKSRDVDAVNIPCKHGACKTKCKTIANLYRHVKTVHWGWGRHFKSAHPGETLPSHLADSDDDQEDNDSVD
ncbi:hypothetical protein OH77DRAFT_1522538 [Trametes cingulata]|nr:hypothetical protein OH77DRAFT_1522538 [Trametes cingulata]